MKKNNAMVYVDKIANIREMGMIILISLLIFFIIMPVRMIYPTETFNPITLSTLLGFVLYYIATYFLCEKNQKRIKLKKVLILMLFGFLLLQLPLRIISFEDTFVTFPDFLVSLFGLLMGYLSFIKQKIGRYLFTAGILVCVFMWFWGYIWFFHWINFGSITGKVERQLIEDIYMTNEKGNKISLYQNRGKTLVLDCWYDGCSNCFKEFPHFQKMSNDFKQMDKIQFYALGVTFNDSINLFEILEKRNVNLPALTIKREDAAKLGITVYPTVIIIDDSSRIIFRGDLMNSELFIKKHIVEK